MVHHNVWQHVQCSEQELAIFSRAIASTLWSFHHLSAHNEVDRLRRTLTNITAINFPPPPPPPLQGCSFFYTRSKDLTCDQVYLCTVSGLGPLSLNQAFGVNDNDWPQPRKRYGSYLKTNTFAELGVRGVDVDVRSTTCIRDSSRLLQSSCCW